MVCFRHLAVVAALFAMAVAPLFAETLTAETSRPNMSTFATGEKVTLTFRATGLAPSSSTSLNILVKDAHDAVVARATIPVKASPDGAWSGEYAAPSGKLGFYRVFPSLTDGTTLAQLFTRPAGYLTYAVVPDPEARVDYRENSFFGMQGGFNPTVEILPYLGIRWVLAGYGWGDMEKDHAGQFAQDFADARAKGQDYPAKFPLMTYRGKTWNTYALPCLNGAPNWASEPAMRGNQPPILPAAEGSYQSFCQEVGKAFPVTYPNQKLHLYQVTWEPVYPWGYKGTDKQLLRIYELAYPALHRTDPKAEVIGPTGGNISTDGVDWAERLFKEGIGKYLDSFSIHPYFPLPPEQNGLIAHIQRLKEIIRRYTGRNLSLYGTEQGFDTKADTASELLQAQGLVRENLIMMGEGFRVNFAFYIADWATDQRYGFYYNLHPGQDYGTDTIGPKPVAPAYAAMTWLVDGHRPTERIDWLAPTTLGYAFALGGDVVLALWDYSDKPREVTIPVGASNVTVYDWMGNAHTQSAPGGLLHMTLTGDPIYIKGASAKIWGASRQKPLRVSTHNVEAFPGAVVTVPARLSAATEPIDGTLRFVLDERLGGSRIVKPVNIPKGGDRQVSFEAHIPPNAQVGDYSATLMLVDKEGRSLMGDGTLIDVASPISVDGVSPIASGRRYSIEVALRDAQPRALGGTITTWLVGVPGSKQGMPFAIAGTQGKTIKLASLDANISQSKVYNAVVQVHTETGYQIDRTFRVDFLEAPKFLSAPILDGSLNGWGEVPGVALAGPSSVVRRPDLWKGDADLSAEVKYAWDEKALYLAVDATDDHFYQANTGFDTWNGDCLQVAIDLDIDKKAAKTGNDLADQGAQHRYSEFTLALTKNGPEVFRTESYDIALFKEALVPLSDIPLAVKRQGDHTLYEAAIPWRMLGKEDSPKIGDRVGVALSVNDVDDAEQPEPKAVGLFGGVNGHKEMGEYGVLTLGASI